MQALKPAVTAKTLEAHHLAAKLKTLAKPSAGMLMTLLAQPQKLAKK